MVASVASSSCCIQPNIFGKGSCINIAVQAIDDVFYEKEEFYHNDPISPFYQRLPYGATKHQVGIVYDGNTMTLSDGRRVRLLGIDSPEPNSIFAQDAKDFTQSKCEQQHDIWLSFEGNRQDHYGRLLAFVWVREKDQYLCLNEAIVSIGLANVYFTSQSSTTTNASKFLSLQRLARENKRGLWVEFENNNVYKTNYGTAYHSADCSQLSKGRNLERMKQSEAMDRGFHACRKCLP